jgi:DNA-binding GntR family transcriptional regulator
MNSPTPRAAGLSPKLYRRAFEVLAEEIVSGAVSAGTHLAETAIAQRFGISRAPARQALSELEREGFVRKSQTRGYEVLPLSGRPPEPDHQPASMTALAADRIQFQPSWELIYGEIEIELVSRTSLASWRINEAALAKAYHVSRTVARDVVARLQQRGIVRKDDSGRWYAPALTEKHIGELYELRWALEPLALEKAFPRLPPDLLDRMLGNVEASMASDAEIDGGRLDALEQELHVELLGHCDHQALMQAISLPQALLVAHHFLYQGTSELFETEPFLPEHLDVLQRLSAGDVTSAKAALVRHLQVSRERAMLRIRAVASTMSPRDLPYLERLDPIRPD